MLTLFVSFWFTAKPVADLKVLPHDSIVRLLSFNHKERDTIAHQQGICKTRTTNSRYQGDIFDRFP